MELLGGSGRALLRRRLAPLVAVLTIAASGCRHDHGAPSALLDGAPARPVPVTLEGRDEPVVLARVTVRAVRSVEAGSPTAACLGDGWSETPAGVVVYRVGVHGDSVTFASASGRSLMACEGTRGTRRGVRSWCGHAQGRLTSGRLRDPRLDLGCRTDEGAPVAFVWVEPGPDARYVVVDQPGFGEAHEVAAGLAVRVATPAGVDTDGTRTELSVSEYAADGRRLRTYELEAGVSG